MSNQSPDCRKPVIGVTGSIGSGKTLVANILGELGCAVIFADRLAHALLDEPATKDFLTANFGTGVIKADGKVDRHKLGEIVFSQLPKIRLLESFVHPRVIAHQNELIARYRPEPSVRAIAVEVPLLFESGFNRTCDQIIVVDAERPLREKRVAESRGWTGQELIRREKFFFSIYLKRTLADAIVYNNSTIEACRQQVETIYSRIISSVPCQLADIGKK